MKRIVAIAIVGLFVSGGLVIWGGIAVFNYFAPPDPLVKMEAMMLEAKGVNSQQLSSCIGKAQSLMSLGPWLEGPIADKVEGLRKACLDHQKPLPTKGEENDSYQI